MKKKFLSMAAIMLAMSLTACGSGNGGNDTAGTENGSNEATEQESDASVQNTEEETPDTKEEGGRSETGAIAVTVPTVQSVFCNDFAEGVKKAAEDNGWTCTIDDPGVDNEAQITALENFVTSGIKGYVLFPVDGNGIADAAQAAMDKGVIITAYDNTCPADYRVIEDEISTGKLLAQGGIDWAKENTDGKIQIAILAPNEAEDSHNGRILTGLQEAIKEELPDAEIVSIQKSVDAAETMNLVENIVQSYPDVQLIYNQLDDMIAYESLKTLGYDREDVCLVGAGGTEDTYPLIKAGTVLRAVLAADIYNTGYACGVATIQAINGEEPDEIEMKYALVTSENVSEFYSE